MKTYPDPDIQFGTSAFPENSRSADPERTIVGSELIRPPAHRSWGRRIVWAISFMVIGVLAWRTGPWLVERYVYATTKGRIQAEYENAVTLLKDAPLSNVSRAFELVAQKIRPSVVSIHTEVPAGDLLDGVLAGQGSGVIMLADGYIITNAHVIENAQQVWVTLHDRRRYPAKQVGEIDTLNDLAVIKIDAPDLIPAEWGDSEALKVGSIVWAIGSPFGYDQTVTSGIVSAKNRIRRNNGHQQMLQTDAAVNPGNSGGPLVNAAGQVVGINTAIHGDQFQGISFAVPSSIAKFVFDQVIEKGYVDFGILGAYPTAVYHRDRDQLGLPDINGALLRQVISGSPADIAGLQPGDVVRRWGKEPIIDHGALYKLVDMTPPDSEVEVEILRDGEPMRLTVTVGSRRKMFPEANLPGRIRAPR